MAINYYCYRKVANLHIFNALSLFVRLKVVLWSQIHYHFTIFHSDLAHKSFQNTTIKHVSLSDSYFLRILEFHSQITLKSLVFIHLSTQNAVKSLNYNKTRPPPDKHQEGQ